MKKFSQRTITHITLLMLFLISISPTKIYGQRVSISTNVVELLNFGTINGQIGLSIAQNWSLYIESKYNPFTFKSSKNLSSNGYTKQMQSRQFNISAGAKYWLWHVNSGWFILGKGGYTTYNRGGITSPATYEGALIGSSLGGGYALMLNRYLNIEFGLGGMVGYTQYTKYACPKCGKIEGSGKKLVILPDNILVQLSYIFN